MREHDTFESVVLPHLDAAYSLASYLLRNVADAEDVTQQACLRALAYFSTYRGDNARAWLLTIVRNAARTWSVERDGSGREIPFDNAVHGEIAGTDNADAGLIRSAARDDVRRALAELTPELREVIVLRELQDLPYGEIAVIIDAPIGTVMSRLSRARVRLANSLIASRPS